MATQSHPLQEGYHKIEQDQWEIIANHELHGVTPEMIDWWWDHIESTERYKLWHPTDHVSYLLLVPPTDGHHVGAVHRIEEYLNGIPETPAKLDIRWEDASNANAEYSHVLLATITGDAQGDLIHEYEAAPFGVRMRSHFHLAPQAPEFIVNALYEHNKQEMQYFTTFLPELYRSQTGG